MLLPVLMLAACLVGGTRAAGCNGASTPGPPNTNPILDAPPRFVATTTNGKHFQIGPSDAPIQLVHVYGSSYDMGFAYGTLLYDDMRKFFPKVKEYMIEQVTKSQKPFMKWVAKGNSNVSKVSTQILR